MQASSRPRLPGPAPSSYGQLQPAPLSSSSATLQPASQHQQLYPALPGYPSSSAVASHAQLAQLQQEDPTYGPLERAGKVVGDHLARDAALVGELGEGLQGTSSSGYTFPPSANFNPFVKRKTFSIPDGLFAEYEALTHKCFMGIFPEIDRAWMTIDNKLFLWDFQESADFSRYDEQSEIIVHVGLVRAKPSVFIESITHLLVICTPTTLHLLGLSAAKSPASKSKDLTLYATDLTIPTDGISMTSVCSTPSGRTFLCGSDGNLHEMVYRADEGWFTKRCGLINWTGGGGGLGVLSGLVPEFLKGKTEDPIVDLTLDPSRSVLYALTKASCIELFLVGPGEQLTRVAKTADVGRSAMMLAPGAQGLLEPRSFVVMSLSAIGKGEGDTGAQMVAVTSKGVRLYFSYYRRGYGGIRNTSGPPNGLELVHVRLPPSNLTLDGQYNPPQQQAAHHPAGPPYANGFQGDLQQQRALPPPSSAPPIKFTSISASAAVSAGVLVAPQQTAADDVDVLLLTSPDLGFLSQPVQAAPPPSTYGAPSSQALSSYGNSQQQQPARPPLVEQCQALAVEGRTWAVAELPHTLSTLTAAVPPSLRVPGRGELRLNELAAAAEAGPRAFLVLTSEGMHVIEKRTAADVLRAVLEANGGGSQGEIVAFFDSYGRDQACALCLALASGADAALATQPSSSGRLSSSVGPSSADASAAAKRLFYEFGGRPLRIERGYGQLGQTTSQMFFSGRHEALAIVLARALRPVWGQKVTLQLAGVGQVSNVAEQTLVGVQRELTALKSFLEKNIQLFTTGPASVDQTSDQSSDAQAWKVEQSSLAALVGLVAQSIEAVSFILLLIDYKLPEILAKCSPELQQSMLNLSYQDLLTTPQGREVARSVVNAVMNQQISQQTSIDAISDVLQQRCGSFCRTDDVVLFKALEGIRKAKESRDPHERNECLRESLRLFVKGTAHLSLQQLKDACEEYRSLQFPTGAIELPLKCAQEWDAEGLGIEYLEDGAAKGDPRQAAYERRQQCYECVFETLLVFDNLLDEEAAGRQPRSIGLGNDAETLRANAYNQALSSADPLFHSSLYDWLSERRLTDQLLEIRTPFIEQYLSSEPLTHSRAELLWQYYVRNGHYAQAAVVQANLAQSTDLELPLSQRLEYLTLAVANAKSSSSTHDGAMSVEFRTDLEEKLDVAQVQIEVSRSIFENPEMEQDLRQELVRQLNERLLTISELYLDFAQPYDLLESTLLILHTSDHRDPTLVANTWEGIIEKICEQSRDACVPVVAAKVAELGRRFFPSETAFPLDFLARRLESFAWETRAASSSAGWVPLALRQAGVDWERIFDVFYAAFEEKAAPWDSSEGAKFLANDVGVLLSHWLEDWSRSQSGYGPRSVSRFPALQVEEFVTNALLPCFVSDADADERKERLRALKRRIMASM